MLFLGPEKIATLCRTLPETAHAHGHAIIEITLGIGYVLASNFQNAQFTFVDCVIVAGARHD